MNFLKLFGIVWKGWQYWQKTEPKPEIVETEHLAPQHIEVPVIVSVNSKFDKNSAARLAKAHPLLQKLMNAAREKISFQILDSQRGKAAQEAAFKAGHSHAHFGQSAHNWEPAVAVDIAPLPLNWKDIDSFVKLSEVILPLAKEMNIPIQWGGSWKSLKDFPHYELNPWRSYAKNLIGS